MPCVTRTTAGLAHPTAVCSWGSGVIVQPEHKLLFLAAELLGADPSALPALLAELPSPTFPPALLNFKMSFTLQKRHSLHSKCKLGNIWGQQTRVSTLWRCSRSSSCRLWVVACNSVKFGLWSCAQSCWQLAGCASISVARGHPYTNQHWHTLSGGVLSMWVIPQSCVLPSVCDSSVMLCAGMPWCAVSWWLICTVCPIWMPCNLFAESLHHVCPDTVSWHALLCAMKSHLTVLTVVLLHDVELLLMLPLRENYTHCSMSYSSTSLPSRSWEQ